MLANLAEMHDNLSAFASQSSFSNSPHALYMQLINLCLN